MSQPKVLFYVQHLLGIGHLKRAVTLAQAMRRGGIHVTVVSGGEAVPVLDAEGVEFVQLPSMRAADKSFKVLLDENGVEIDDAWRAARRDRLLAVFDEAAPDVLMVELFPFGRRQLRFELIPLLEAAKAARPAPAVVCSVRDILVEKAKPERNREMIDTALAYFDAVLVHGDRNLIPFEATFPHVDELGSRLIYTGYVVDAVGTDDGAGERRGVIVSAGGGAVGDDLLRVAMSCRAGTRLADQPWRLLAGHNMDEAAYQRLRGDAPAGVTVERARPDFVRIMRSSAVSISQGGYNTVMELLATGTRGVIVPYAGGEESEQTIRARLLADRGLVVTVDEAGLTPALLAPAVEAALDLSPLSDSLPRLDGADETARQIRRLAGGSPP